MKNKTALGMRIGVGSLSFRKSNDSGLGLRICLLKRNGVGELVNVAGMGQN